MATNDNNDYHVMYDANREMWLGKREGASRASVVGDTQKAVADQTRDLARKSGGELNVHRKDNNQIRAKDSYGSDPLKSKG